MANLTEYLTQKRDALLRRKAHARSGDAHPLRLQAQAHAEGRSGIRRIRIRDFQVISDSPPDFAGYDLGPSSPELLLGALSSCLTHTYLIQAADQQIALQDVSVEVHGQLDPRAGTPGHETTPIYPHDLSYTVRLTTDVTDLDALNTAVERFCPILNLLRQGVEVRGTVERVPASRAAA